MYNVSIYTRNSKLINLCCCLPLIGGLYNKIRAVFNFRHRNNFGIHTEKFKSIFIKICTIHAKVLKFQAILKLCIDKIIT